MNLIDYRRLIGLICVLVIIMIFPVLRTCRNSDDSAHESVRRSDEPIPREKVLKSIAIPLPKSAHNVYYLECVNAMQCIVRYVRYDANQDDLPAAADALVTAYNKKIGRSIFFPKAVLNNAVMPMAENRFLPMPWWDPNSANIGYYQGRIDGYVLRILVDEGRSRIYFYESDYPICK